MQIIDYQLEKIRGRSPPLASIEQGLGDWSLDN